MERRIPRKALLARIQKILEEERRSARGDIVVIRIKRLAKRLGVSPQLLGRFLAQHKEKLQLEYVGEIKKYILWTKRKRL